MGSLIDYIDSYRLFAFATGVAVVMAMSMYITMRAGVFSFGINGFMAIGAYTAALLTLHYDAPFIPALLVGGVAAACVAMVVGLPLLRLRGIFFGIATVAFGEVVRTFVSNFELTGGALGLMGIATHTGYVHVLGFIVLVVFLIKVLERSKYGAALFAMQQDELVAGACGVNTARLRTLVFMFSAFIAGVGGGLMAHYSNAISPGDFGFPLLIQTTTNAVVGGFGALAGPIIGSLAVSALSQWLTYLQEWQPLVLGVMILLVILLLPKGLLGLPGLRLLDGSRPRAMRPLATPGEETAAIVAAEPVPLTGAGRVSLDVRGVTKRYGGVVAVQACSFRCEGGQILGIIGPNGAGKTTLLNMLTAMVPPTSGTIVCGGTDVARLRPHEVAAHGLARTFQNIRLLPDFTVAQNVLMGRYWCEPGDLWRTLLLRPRWEAREQAEVARLLRMVGIEHKKDFLASQLPYGEQRCVEIARALAARPRILLVDEPTAGMNPTETAAVAELLKRVREQGVGVVLVAHDLDLIAEVCDRVVVVNFGTVIAEGSASDVRKDPRVIDAYIGEEFDEEPAIATAQ